LEGKAKKKGQGKEKGAVSTKGEGGGNDPRSKEKPYRKIGTAEKKSLRRKGEDPKENIKEKKKKSGKEKTTDTKSQIEVLLPKSKRNSRGVSSQTKKEKQHKKGKGIDRKEGGDTEQKVRERIPKKTSTQKKQTWKEEGAFPLKKCRGL